MIFVVNLVQRHPMPVKRWWRTSKIDVRISKLTGSIDPYDHGTVNQFFSHDPEEQSEVVEAIAGKLFKKKITIIVRNQPF